MRIPSSFPALTRWPRRAVAVVASVATISSFIGLVGLLGVPAASATGEACAPQITSVSAVAAAQTQTVTITGSCFGTTAPPENTYTDSGSFAISDGDPSGGPTTWWQACFENNQLSANEINCDITGWSDTSITFSGFGSAYSSNNWYLTNGDPVVISVWDSDTVGSADPMGPANCIVTVGAGATDCAEASLPSAPSTTVSSALSAGSVALGGSVTDTAVVTGETLPSTTYPSGDPSAGIPTGTVDFYVCGPFPSPELCSSTSSGAGSETLTPTSVDSPGSPGSDDFATATSSSFVPEVAGIYCFASVYGGGSYDNGAASYEGSADNNSGTVDPNECVNVTGPGSATNTSWPTAEIMTPTPMASTTGTIANSGESLWYDFAVQPDEQVQVSLSDVPADYNVLAFSDIGAAFQAATSSTPNLAALGAQSPGSDSSYNQISPLGVSPLGVSPLGVSPLGISPLGVSPLGVSPLGVSPLGVSSGALNPANFNPALTPAELTDAYSDAEVDSLLAVSSASGAVDKSVTIDTWNNTGNFYVAITGNNGAYSPNAFTLGVTVTGNPACAGVTFNTDGLTGNLPGTGTNGQDHTVIVDNSVAMPAVASGGSLYTPLQKLASETSGAVVDVSQVPGVEALITQAANNPGCPYAEDVVADAVQDIINSYRGPDGGPNLQNVVIVGDDDVIPFFRYADNAGLGAESSYEPPLLSNSAANAALQTPDYLSDDQYGAASELDIQGTTVPLQTAAVGRLVETPADILATVDSYLSQTDGGSGNQVIAPKSTLATGYSFMQPPATQVASAFAQGVTGGTNSTLITNENVPATTTGEPPSANYSWTAGDLSTALFGSGHHDLVFLGGHFSANALEAADDTTTITTNHFASSVGTTLADSLVLSAGCHSGYTIDPADGVPDVTDTLSWPQAFAEAGATLIAGTGYQYGDTNYVAYSDQLYVDLANQLGYQPSSGSGSVDIGTALLGAEQQYLSTLDKINGIEEKALLQVTLYGLPMLGVQEPHQTAATTNSSVISSTVAAAAGTPGGQLGLQYADLNVNPIDLSSQTVTPPGSSTTYTYESGPQGVTADPSSPVLPVLTDDVNAPPATQGATPGTLRGVGFLGGSYTDSQVSNPLTGDPVTDTANPEVTPFTSPVFFPQTMWNPNYFSTLLNGEGTTNLTFTPVQYESATGTSADLRTYGDLDVRLFYSNNTNTFGSNTPALAAAPTISYVTSTTTANMVNVSATVTGDPSAGVQDVWVTYTGDKPGNPLYGSWQSVHLTQSPTNSTLWTGSFTDTGSENPASDSVFMVQAVNGVGEVSMDDNGGYYFTPSFTPGAPLTNANTYSLKFGGDTSDPYMGTATVSAQLQQTSGTGGNIVGQTITFGLGGASTTAITVAGGTASLTIPVTLPPGSYSFTAYYAGDTSDAPAGTQETFTVNRASTALTLSPPGQITSGANNGFSATLTSGGAPLSQKTVYFDVSSGATLLLSVPAITNNSGVAQSGAITLPPGDVGSDTVTAYFGSDAVPLAGGSSYNASDLDYLGSTASGPLTVKDASQTALVAPSASTFGSSVSLKATVSAVVPGSGTPTGTVTFYDGSGIIGTMALGSAGTATLVVTGLQAGSQSFSASYGGSSSFAPSSSVTATDVVGFTQTISGTYSGSLSIKAGQLVLVTGKVTGSVSVSTGGALEVDGGSIGGALASTGALAFTLCNAKVGGSLSVSGSTGFVFIGGSVPAATGCGGSSVAGAMSLSNNKGGLEMATSTVSGAASITGNSGYGPVQQSGAFPPPEVAGNTISGALACSGNLPKLTDAGMSNKAAVKAGQCDTPTTF